MMAKCRWLGRRNRLDLTLLRASVQSAECRYGLTTAEGAAPAVVEAVDMGLTKLFVELVAHQEAAVAMFNDLGFEGEALLENHVRDRRGELHDLLVLAHHVEGNAASMAAAGLDRI